MNIKERTSSAKMKLILNGKAIFITSVLCSTQIVFDETLQAEAATDGKRIIINPTLTAGISDDTLVSNLLHECYHIILKHVTRCGNRDKQKWNVACDFAINQMLKKDGFDMTGFIYDEAYEDMSAETIYEMLPECPPESHSDLMPSDAMSEEEKQDIEAHVNQVVSNAAVSTQMQNKDYGNIPAYMQVMIQEILNPKVPWQNVLQNICTSFNKDDYSYRRPNRRYIDLVMPTLYSECMGTIGAAVDASGSTSDKEFTQFLSELDTIQATYQPECIHLVDFDTRIHSEHKIAPNESVFEATFEGRGGTDLQCVFDKFKGADLEALIIFSDLYCSVIPAEEEPDFKVIWICVGNPNAQVNFGEIVHIEV